MDTRLFDYYLLRRPEVAAAVMSLVDAEAAFEGDSKHFPYVAAGGSVDDESAAERITALAQTMVTAGQPQQVRKPSEDPAAVVVKLADGWELRSGVYEPDDAGALTCGEWVSLHRPDGSEYAYWDAAEWRDDPALAMGAIINSAAGYRILDADDQAAHSDRDE